MGFSFRTSAKNHRWAFSLHGFRALCIGHSGSSSMLNGLSAGLFDDTYLVVSGLPRSVSYVAKKPRRSCASSKGSKTGDLFVTSLELLKSVDIRRESLKRRGA